MEPADDSSDDLAVRLDWPDDPLAADANDNPPDDEATDDDLDTRLAALESTIGHTRDEEVVAAVEAVANKLDQVTKETVKVLRAVTASLRRTRDQNAAALEKGLGQLRSEVAALVETQNNQRDDLTAELKAWRKRLPTSTPVGKLNEAAMEELVERLADEMELRVVAALKKSGVGKKR